MYTSTIPARSVKLMAAPGMVAPLWALSLPPIKELELFYEEGGLGSNDWVKLPTLSVELGVGYFCVTADGRTVLKARSEGSVTTLYLRSLSKGVYTVLYRDDKWQTTRSRLTTK